MNPKQEHALTVTGIVVPNDWDRTGRLAEVMLCGQDESEYVVAGTRQQELFPLCHHRLSATGTETRDARGRRILVVSDFNILGDKTDCGYESGFSL